MIRRFLMVTSLAGFLFALSAYAQPAYQNAQSDQQSPKVQTITGKVTQVETGGKAFSVEVTQGSDKKPMRFVVGKETTVQGHVAAGSMASVDYQSDASGQLVALSVKEQTAQQPQ
ncbi:MAG TPA: hypothetical protein VG272_10435 [Candidatus Acidoferrales bacterium]|nr:hypothetical protein [Candidatus Acidoferrales bacterium]